MPIRPHRPTSRHDWPGLKAKFMAWEGTAKSFAKANKITAAADFYRRIKSERWQEERAEVAQKALLIAKEGISYSMAARWIRYRELIDRCLTQVEKVANTKKKVTPQQLAALGTAIDKFIKADSFLHGGPTERVDDRREKGVTHADIVAIIHAVQNKDPRLVHPETIEAQKVDG